MDTLQRYTAQMHDNNLMKFKMLQNYLQKNQLDMMVMQKKLAEVTN